jgi:hypothetical protein
VTIERLVEADRQNRLSGAYVLADLVVQENLWKAVERILPRMGQAPASRKRYECSFDALKRKASDRLGATASIADLVHVPWAEVKEAWGRSAADWNHLRRALSSFLTLALNDKYHSFRRSVMQRFLAPLKSGAFRTSHRICFGGSWPQHRNMCEART